MKYYLSWLKYKDSHLFAIWSSDADFDGFVQNENKKIVAFQSIKEASAFAQQKELKIEQEEPFMLDLDIIMSWLYDPKADEIDCKSFLNVWNFCNDVRSTIHQKCMDGEEDPHYRNTYLKLFYGSNLPSVTPIGETWNPTWDKEDLQNIIEFLKTGLKNFDQNLSLYTT